MYSKMYEKYELEGSEFTKIMIVQRKALRNSPEEKVDKVILAWFLEDNDAPYQYSVTEMYNEKSFGNGEYFMTKFDEDALQKALNEYNNVF